MPTIIFTAGWEQWQRLGLLSSWWLGPGVGSLGTSHPCSEPSPFPFRPTWGSPLPTLSLWS